MTEKKLLLVGPPDSEKSSWCVQFQGMLTKMGLLYICEKRTFIDCSEIPFTYLHCKVIAWFLYFTNFY